MWYRLKSIFLLLYLTWGVVLCALCRLRSIATHRDDCLSVCLSHFSVTLSRAMFRRRHMHSSECCHYFCYLVTVLDYMYLWFLQNIFKSWAIKAIDLLSQWLGRGFCQMGHFQLFSIFFFKFSMDHFLSIYTDFYGPFSKLMGLWRMAPCLSNHWVFLHVLHEILIDFLQKVIQKYTNRFEKLLHRW